MHTALPRLLAMPVFALALASCAAAPVSTASAPASPSTAPATAPTPATAPAAARAAIAWDAAKSHVGQILTVAGPVVSTHTTRDGSHVVLNVGKDYPDPDRFTVYMPVAKDAPSPNTLYTGKTISVTGEIVLFQDVPEVKAEAKDIIIVK